MGRVVRSAHGVDRTGSCSWKVHVKDGIITWQTQQADYPSRAPPRHGDDRVRDLARGNVGLPLRTSVADGAC